MIHERVLSAQRGENPTVLCRMESGWAVMADMQILNGYCLLLPDPVPPDLNTLNLAERVTFLRDMSLIGDALLEVTGAVRINYEILGNSDPALHAHIIPRYDAEPETMRKGPVWFYDLSQAPPLDLERYKPMMDSIRAAIKKRMEALGN